MTAVEESDSRNGVRGRSARPMDWAAGLLSMVVMGAGILELLDDYFTQRMDMERFFNSDTLFLPNLFKDLSQGRFSFSHWHFSAATFIFPDWILYGVSHLLARDIYHAVPLFFCLQIGVCWGLVWGLSSLLSQESFPKTLLGASFFLGIVLFLAQRGVYPFTIILLSVTHFGELLSWMAATLLLLIFLKRRKSSWVVKGSLAAGIGGLTFLTTASDKLFVVDWAVPSILTLGFLSFLKVLGGADLLILLGGIAFGMGAGLAVYHLYPHVFNGVGVAIGPAAGNARAIVTMMKNFYLDYWAIAAVLLVIGIGWVLFLFRFLRGCRNDRRSLDPMVFMAIFFPVGLIASLGTMAFSTYRIVDESQLRYLAPYLLGPIFLMPPLVRTLLRNGKARQIFMWARRSFYWASTRREACGLAMSGERTIIRGLPHVLIAPSGQWERHGGSACTGRPGSTQCFRRPTSSRLPRFPKTSPPICGSTMIGTMTIHSGLSSFRIVRKTQMCW